MDDEPVLTIIAGPNGSGKTTLTQALRRAGVDLGRYINPDEIAESLGGEPSVQRSRLAQEAADEAREECLRLGISFSFETVMSHPSKIEVLRKARRLGYRIVLYFVALESAVLNIHRVRQRVTLGGHPVPEDRIAPRYARSLALLPRAIEQCDRAILFDNSYRATTTSGIELRPFCEVRRIAAYGKPDRFEFRSELGVPLTRGQAMKLPSWSHALLNSQSLPGQHKPARGRISDVGLQLRAKQQLKGYYGDITEKQFKRTYAEAGRMEGDTGQNLIGLLERRLDMVVYRAKFAPTLWAARQLISHGHVRVNGVTCKIASRRVNPGGEISLSSKAGTMGLVMEAQGLIERDIPSYIEPTGPTTVIFARVPTLDEVPYPVRIDPNLVVELYSRAKLEGRK